MKPALPELKHLADGKLKPEDDDEDENDESSNSHSPFPLFSVFPSSCPSCTSWSNHPIMTKMRLVQARRRAFAIFAPSCETSFSLPPIVLVLVVVLHFSAAGQQLLGFGFAFQTAYLLWMPGAFTPAMIAAGRTDPAADADGDGIANDAELVAGTDPTNALSVQQASLRGTGPGIFEISYPSVTGRHYSVESQGAPTNTVWTPTLTPLAGTGSPVARAVTNSAATGYLRVHVDWP